MPDQDLQFHPDFAAFLADGEMPSQASVGEAPLHVTEVGCGPFVLGSDRCMEPLWNLRVPRRLVPNGEPEVALDAQDGVDADGEGGVQVFVGGVGVAARAPRGPAASPVLSHDAVDPTSALERDTALLLDLCLPFPPHGP